MMIQNSYKSFADPALLRTMILGEIVGAQGSQAAIEELGLSIATHVGFKRTRNEDRAAVARVAAPNTETYTVALVCDGVGGSEFGDQAAALATASIIADLAQQRTLRSLAELVVELVQHADDTVRHQFHGRGTTTLVILLASTSGDLVCANVGDSRVYSWEPELSKLRQVTTDDTIENELKNLPGNGAGLIRAHGLQGRLSQAIGETGRSSDELRIQTYSKEHFPHGAVLGSDGLWRVAKDFETLVAYASTPIDAVRRAITHANLVGGVDNSSMIAISDVAQWCSRRPEQVSDDSCQRQLEIWLSSIKVKIPINSLYSEAKSASPRGKLDRAKPKSRRRDRKSPEDIVQLELEAVDSNGLRPKIEVSITEEPKKNR